MKLMKSLKDNKAKYFTFKKLYDGSYVTIELDKDILIDELRKRHNKVLNLIHEKVKDEYGHVETGIIWEIEKILEEDIGEVVK